MSIALDPSLAGLDGCDCCAGGVAGRPGTLFNRPGLAAIEYRAGTHADFFANLLAGLSTDGRPGLARLGTREPDDFTIAFLDALATVADLTTFYSERIANESYLRTAGERLSVLELARAIGYELDPGVAAEAALAFDLEDAAGAPPVVEVGAGTQVKSVPGPGEQSQAFETTEAFEARPQWNELRPRQVARPGLRRTEAFVEGVDTGLAPGDAVLLIGGEDVAVPVATEWDLRRLDAVDPDPLLGITRLSWRSGIGDRVMRVEPGQVAPRIFAMRLRATLFGSTAPDWSMVSAAVRGDWLGPDWPGLTIGEIADEAKVVHLEGWHPGVRAQPRPGIGPQSWLVLSREGSQEIFRVSGASESARQGFGLALKTTKVTLEGKTLEGFEQRVRDTVAFLQSEPLALAEAPIEAAVAGSEIELQEAVPPLPAGRAVIVSGRPSESAPGAPEEAELVTLAPGETGELQTRLQLSRPLERSYARETVRIAANVVRVTHGESVAEPLGSGDASAAFQRFELRGAPLTHVYATTPQGRRSTLELRVGGLLWEEAPSLFACQPGERVYALRRDAEGVTTVETGDGHSGARLPGGEENVVAAYRKGLGDSGNVGAGALSLLTTRPLGVRGVRNPLPASGGEDPERLEQARQNAPRTVLTLGRIVSLADYAAFARGFAGVGKAHATWVWGHAGRAVLLTVAGSRGESPREDGPLLRSLPVAIAAAGDREVEVHIVPYEKVPFSLAARVTADDAMEPAALRAAVEAELRERFCFAARELGQAVTPSEVLATLHAVPGVVAVDVDALHERGASGLRRRLSASLPRPGEKAELAAPAQLLSLDLRDGDVEVIA